MKNILIVDDDTVTLGLLSRVFKPHGDDICVITAEDGTDAVKEMSTKKIDLVLTDIQMPVMDGFELLEYMGKNHPEIPIFIMTAFGTPEIETKTKSLGITKYFEKPLNMDELTEAIFEELDAGAEGKIDGIGLPSFLQLVEMEKKTCTLAVTTNENKGFLYFLKGELISAETKNLKNDKAAYEIIAWDKSSITIKNYSKKKTKEIKQPLINIMMEALKLKDEKDKESAKPKSALKPPSKPLKEKQEFTAAPKQAGVSKANKPDTKSPRTEKLSQILKKMPTINEFKIFDGNDFVQAKSSTSNPVLQFAPSEYFSLAEELRSLFKNGSLKHFVVNTAKGLRYLFFQIDDSRIIISLKPGIQPKDFFSKVDIERISA